MAIEDKLWLVWKKNDYDNKVNEIRKREKTIMCDVPKK